MMSTLPPMKLSRVRSRPSTEDELYSHRRTGHPYRESWHRMGRHFRQRFHGLHLTRQFDILDDPGLYPRPPNGTCRVQAIRSVSDWSHGVLTEHSIQNACEMLDRCADWCASDTHLDCQLIMEANHFIYIGTSMRRLPPNCILTLEPERKSILVSTWD